LLCGSSLGQDSPDVSGTPCNIPVSEGKIRRLDGSLFPSWQQTNDNKENLQASSSSTGGTHMVFEQKESSFLHVVEHIKEAITNFSRAFPE
jgi:hypothetical protein